MDDILVVGLAKKFGLVVLISISMTLAFSNFMEMWILWGGMSLSMAVYLFSLLNEESKPADSGRVELDCHEESAGEETDQHGERTCNSARKNVARQICELQQREADIRGEIDSFTSEVESLSCQHCGHGVQVADLHCSQCGGALQAKGLHDELNAVRTELEVLFRRGGDLEAVDSESRDESVVLDGGEARTSGKSALVVVFGALVILGLLLSAFEQLNRKGVTDMQICKAAISSLFNQRFDAVSAQEIDRYIHTSYIRASDGKEFNNMCYVEGDRIIWNSVGGEYGGVGQWRIRPLDTRITFDVPSPQTLVILHKHSDGSGRKSRYRLDAKNP